MDLLLGLRVFAAVAETGSFSAAARLLRTSQPSVSREIAALESHFGVRLFGRTTRSVTITADGTNLLAYARDMLRALQEAETTLGRQRHVVDGTVRIGTPIAFGLFLTQQVGALLSRHPGLAVDLVMRDGFGDAVEEGMDLAVQVGLPTETTMIARHLADVPTLLVAAPDYLRREGPPTGPEQLRHQAIVYTYGTRDAEWRFSRGREVLAIVPGGRFRANNSEAVHRAALSGLGIAMMPEYLVRDDVEAGRLSRIALGWQSPSLQLNVAYPGLRTLPLRTRTVLDFLCSLPFRGTVSGGG